MQIQPTPRTAFVPRPEPDWSQNSEKATPKPHNDIENRPAEAPPTNTNRKRKSTESTEAVPDTNSPEEAATSKPAKRLKTTPIDKKEAKAALKAAAASLLDVSSIVNLKPDEPTPVYDTCDTIRRKIRAMLAKDGVTQADFLRAIVTAAYGHNSTKKIQASSLYSFLKQKGPLAGNTSGVYYAAYVFFEKLRVKQGKPKSKDREIMEEIHPGGLDTKVQSGKISYVVGAGSKVWTDKFGRVRSSRDCL